jgi:hypothetical protein
MKERPERFALTVAAEAFKVPRRKLEHDLKHGRFPNADRRRRYIPYEDLVAAGYNLDPRWLRGWRGYLQNAERIRKQRSD